MKTANEKLSTCGQIESTGVKNVDAICAVPGVGESFPCYDFENVPADLAKDSIFIGPNDLALSLLGYVSARGDEPKFVDAVESIVAAARKHGKWVAEFQTMALLLGNI